MPFQPEKPATQASEGTVQPAATPAPGKVQQLFGPMVSGLALVVGAALILRSMRTMRSKQSDREEAAIADIRARLAEPRDDAPPARRPEPRTSAIPAVAADMEALAERLAVKLDARAARLERLIADADAKITMLERTGSITLRAPTARPAASIRPPLPAPPASNLFGRSDDEVPTVHRKIHELADQGIAARDIAKRLEQPVGQVELVLALRRAGGLSA